MGNHVLYWIAVGAIALPVLLIAGCPTSSEGIDLSELGELNLVVSRVSQSSTATATAQVMNSSIVSVTQRKIVLADDQILSVNNVPLTGTTWTDLGVDATVTATLEAVDAPDTYTIRFDNQGVTTTFAATPPEDFLEVTPASATEVPRGGFELAWEPSGDEDVTVSITITGLVLFYAEDGSWQVIENAVALADLADEGAATIGTTELSQFLAGNITATLTRLVMISHKLGFSDGTIHLKIVREIPLTLVESATETATD